MPLPSASENNFVALDSSLGFKSKVDRYPDPGSLVKKQTYVTCVCTVWLLRQESISQLPSLFWQQQRIYSYNMPISFLKNNMNECRQSAKG